MHCIDLRSIRADDLCLAALMIRALLHRGLRIAVRLPLENLRGVSAEKGTFSMSRTVRKIITFH